MRDPAFWWRPAGLAGRLLSPLGEAYGAVAAWRMARPGHAIGVPVICIGNLTLGGAGKTPTAIAAAQMLAAAGRRPFLLSRGYGGACSGPVLVDPARHRAAEIGDEPLQLARSAPTVVSRDRVAGAKVACAAGAGSIVMDDGFQNPALAKNRSILVVDGNRGLGNGRVFPAGPLRAPLATQLGRAQALLVIGDGAAGETVAAAGRSQGLAVFRGRLEPDAQALAPLKERPALAFAGIGDPGKFLATLHGAGIDVRKTVWFADHHRYRRAEAKKLIEQAESDGLTLVTTEKDQARLVGEADLAALASVVRVVPVRLTLAAEPAFRQFVLG
jgi:tetraacyldisaccharide 4'-kinase